MFWTTGQNAASSRRSAVSRAHHQLGPRGVGGGGKYSACGSLAPAAVRTSMSGGVPSLAWIPIGTRPDPGSDSEASYGEARHHGRSTPGDRHWPRAARGGCPTLIAVVRSGQRPDANPGRQAHLLAVRELLNVLGTQRSEPPHLAALIRDDDLRQDRAGSGQGTLKARKNIGIAGNLVEA